MRGSHLAVIKHLAVVSGVEQSLLFTKRSVRRLHWFCGAHPRGASLCSEALTALGTATVKNMTAAFGGHAGAKTVSTLALEYAGLKSSFHVYLPNSKSD